MGSKKDTFKKQFQTNKTNTIKRSDKKYNKQTSKSDKEYISGNYVSSVDKKIFGIKNSLAEGKKVNGYGDDYVDTKGMKRSRYLKKQAGENPYDVKYKYTGKKKTVKGGVNSKGEKYNSYTTRKERLTKYEKESFKNTGTLNDKEYMPKQKYAILSSHKWDNAEKLDDHFNTGVADGYKTAKANQRKGKHVSNAIEYLKGGVKDILVDPAVDFMKGVGAISSYGLAGVAGIAEDSGNVFKAIADPSRDLKYYTQGRNNTLENLKANKKELDKTGFGKSMGSFLNEAKVRADDAEIRFLNETGRSKDAEEYKKQIEKNKKRDTNLLNATGFVMELLAPSTIEDKIVDGMKILGKNTAKSFKELKNGTASLATGIVPEETAKLMANSKKYAGKGKKVTNASDDVFYSGKKGSTSIDKKLDNEFNKTVNRVKDVVKQNPKTKNIGNFLDTLDEKPLKGTQRKIDGRTLNKKYTQTKDGYIPNQINKVDELENIVSGNVNGQYSMFDKNGSMNAYIDNVQNPYARYERVINKYGDDIDGFIEKIDSMSSHNADATLDYLRKTRPEVYEQVVKGSDEITDVIEGSARRRGYESEIKTKADARYHKTPNVREFSNIDKVDDLSKLNDNYNKFNLERMFNNAQQQSVQPRMSIQANKSLFKSGVDNYLANIHKLDYNGLEQASEGLKRISSMDKNTPIYKKVDELNKMLFGGQKVIRDNIPSKTLDGILDYLENNINLNIADRLGEHSFDFKNGNQLSKFNIYDENGVLKNISNQTSKFAPSAVDILFEDKMSNIASKLGVNSKSEITNKIKEYKEIRKTRPLTQDEYYDFKNLQEQENTWNTLYQEVANMTDGYDEYAKKTFGKNNGLEGYNTVLDELAEKQAKIDATKGRENQIKEAKRNFELGSDPDVTASPRSQSMLHNGDVNEFNHITQNNTIGNIKNQIKPKDKIEYSKNIGLKYVNSKYGIQIPKDKQTFKNVYANKNVSNAIDNLTTLMNKEAKLTQSGKYGEEYTKIRLLVQDNIKYLDDLGVDRNVYFNKIKEQKLKLLQDMQISKNLNGIKPMSGTAKNTTKGMNPLEMTHVKINGKAIDNLDELTPDQLQWKYLMTEGAKTIDELFDIPDPKMLQRGDNIGNDIASSLRPNKSSTPLDNIPNNTDYYVDDFERVIEQENIKHSEELRKKMEQNSNKTKVKSKIDPRTEERLKYYESKLNLPEPKTLDELEFNIPGVDEDGVIQDLTKTFDSKSPDKTPSFEEFKETVSKNSDGKLPYEDSKLYDVYKRWLNSWKKGLTVYNPGWHVQNFFQNKGQNYLALGADAFKPQTEARNILKQINGKKAKDVNIFDSKNLKSYSSDEIGKLAQELGVVDGLGEDVRNARGIFPKLEQWVDNTPLMKSLEKNEQTARLHHFIEQIKRGNTPEQASELVNKYLFDYGNKSKFDKVMGDFADPFWTFHKNNAKLMYGSMFEHPSKINSIVRGTNGLETGIPEEQRQNEEYKYGKIQKPYANFTDDVNNAQYNYLYKQNMFPDVEDAIPFEGDALENKMNPILRMLLQQSRGEGNFGNEIVEGDEAGWNEITKKQRAKEVLMDLNPFMPNAVKTMDSILERQQKADNGKQSQETSDKQILMDFINYITGNKGNWYRNIDF